MTAGHVAIITHGRADPPRRRSVTPGVARSPRTAVLAVVAGIRGQ